MKYLISIQILLFAITFNAQQNFKSINAKKTFEKIKIDGDLSDSTWQTAEITGNFWQNFPFDSSLAKTKTEVMVAYSDQYLYIAL